MRAKLFATPTREMMLWQKQASDSWLAKNEQLLEEFGPEQVAVIARPGRMRSLVQVFCDHPSAADRLQRKFGGHAKKLPRNWLALYQPPTSRAPLRIGNRLEIVPDSMRTSKVTKNRLIIPAAGAFGTGEHATTAMSLRLLEETTRKLPPGWRLLDAGTGTGIFALAALRLGAGAAIGLDNDPRAVAHARQNARLNRVSRARFIAADVLRWKTEARFEIITANLFSELLIATLPFLRRVLRPHGQLILSGILREQSVAVERALHRSGFRLRKKRRRSKWVALLAGL
ncbi:MAG: 50S ribosomal protein L11 methyltransferase [Chthoniobacterales bacterium]